jgi:DNA-binding transcriptional MerR regulator
MCGSEMSPLKNITELAKLLGIDRITLGRWVERYAPYMSPGATPPKGKARNLTETDVRVLHLVATLRDTGIDHDDIELRLKEMQGNGWSELPEIPSEWQQISETMPVTEAASRAYELAQVAVLQSELKHVQQALQEVQGRVVQLEGEIQRLEGEKEDLAGEKQAVEEEKQKLQVELERSRAEARELQAELRAFGLAYGLGRERPISVAVIIGVTALVAAVLVVAAVVVGALLR